MDALIEIGAGIALVAGLIWYGPAFIRRARVRQLESHDEIQVAETAAAAKIRRDSEAAAKKAVRDEELHELQHRQFKAQAMAQVIQAESTVVSLMEFAQAGAAIMPGKDGMLPTAKNIALPGAADVVSGQLEVGDDGDPFIASLQKTYRPQRRATGQKEVMHGTVADTHPGAPVPPPSGPPLNDAAPQRATVMETSSNGRGNQQQSTNGHVTIEH